MEKKQAEAIKTFLTNGTFPSEFPSNKSNFTRTANQYTINPRNNLERNGLVVLMKKQLPEVWATFHVKFIFMGGNNNLPP